MKVAHPLLMLYLIFVCRFVDNREESNMIRMAVVGRQVVIGWEARRVDWDDFPLVVTGMQMWATLEARGVLGIGSG